MLTHFHYTKTSEFSYSAKPDFPCGGCGSQFETWPPCHHISEIERRRAFIVDSLKVFWGAAFRNGIAEYIMPLHPPFMRPFKKYGGNFVGPCSSWSRSSLSAFPSTFYCSQQSIVMRCVSHYVDCITYFCFSGCSS